MATITIVQARKLKNEYADAMTQRGGAELPDCKETTGQSYAAGAPIYKDTNGTVAVCTSSGNIVPLIAGFANAAAAGVAGTQVRYDPIHPGDVLLINLKGTVTTVTALTLLGSTTTGHGMTMFDLSSGLLVANPDAAFDATKLHGKIIGLYTTLAAGGGYNDGDAVGDTNGRLLVLIPDQQALQY